MQRSDYAWAPLTWEQYQAIITDGTMPGYTSPMLNRADYDSLVTVLHAANIDPRLGLAFTYCEGHHGSDPGLVAAKVNNLGGVKFVGAPGTTDSGIAADTGGTYAAFPDLTTYWQEWVRIMNNSIIGPDFNSGNLIGAVEHYTNGPGSGHNKIDKWQEYVAAYPAGATPPGTPVVAIYGEDVARAALKHLGETHEWDNRNGDHPVSMYCEADVEDWCAEAGVPQPAMPSAAANADRAPLSTTFPAPMGALVFFKGPGWSDFGHVGVSYSDQGGTISGLQSVVVSNGWQATAAGCVGWRFPDGVTAAHPPVPGNDPDIYYAPGNPYGAVPMKAPLWNRWNKLDSEGLALPQLGFPVRAETTLPNGRRVQQFERGWLGTQQAPDPWDVVTLLTNEIPK